MIEEREKNLSLIPLKRGRYILVQFIFFLDPLPKSLNSKIDKV